MKRVARIVAAVIAISVLLVAALRIVAPLTTAVMLEAWIAAAYAGHPKPIDYRWVPWNAISPNAALAVIAAEDQKFPSHRGFDFDAIDSALTAHDHGRRLRGASTISQQVAKNLFLWSGRSWLRKGLEAYFTVLIEALWPKRRILEVYLNVAELGPGIYGVEAASRRYFDKPAARLTLGEAARLAAVLPRPRSMHADRPSSYVQARSAHIEAAAAQLGGRAYLKRVDPRWSELR